MMIKKTLRLSLIFFLIIYILWSLWIYRNEGISFVRWHTHIMVYVYSFLAINVIFKSVKKYIAKATFEKLTLSVNSILAVLLFIECLMMTNIGYVKTYSELNNGRYMSMYQPLYKGTYHKYPSHAEIQNYKAEFSYLKNANAEGFVDYEWTVDKLSNKKRIIASGDSFTEGDGAAQDSNYVASLRRMLPSNYEIMNAGICGSDPVNNVKIIEDLLLKYQPDIILQTIDANDVLSDFRIRGGFDRFNRTTEFFSNQPKWEWLYAVSYIFRIIIRNLGYDYALQPETISPAEFKKLWNITSEVFKRYQKLAEQNNFQVFVIIKKNYDEIYYNNTIYQKYTQTFSFDYNKLIRIINSFPNLQVIELEPCYLSKVNNDKTKLRAYFWEKDKHHNAKGYQMMADCIFKSIEQELK